MHGKTVVGCQYGSVVPGRDFPMLLNLWRTGALPLDKLITGRITLDDVNSAFDDLVQRQSEFDPSSSTTKSRQRT